MEEKCNFYGNSRHLKEGAASPLWGRNTMLQVFQNDTATFAPTATTPAQIILWSTRKYILSLFKSFNTKEHHKKLYFISTFFKLSFILY